ncbi:hypothetical protein LTR08_000573 [Meristemomyces frigidus]|nr:hypothetical protein LTR08_000573 [Meristemomyces frigidus]
MAELSNAVRVYQALDTDMHKLRRQNTDETSAEAERIATLLLEYADLPIVFRARACMILARSDTPGYLAWAQEAVRVIELGISQIVSKGRQPGPGEDELLAACKKVLENAEADFAEFGYPAEDEKESEEEGEVVWTVEDGWLDEKKGGAGPSQPTLVEGTDAVGAEPSAGHSTEATAGPS